MLKLHKAEYLVIPVKRMKLSKGLILSLIIHGLLLCALFNTSIGNKKIQSPQEKNKPINSYIYTKKISVDKPKVEIANQTAEQKTKQTPIQQSEQLQNERQQEVVAIPSINTVTPETKDISNQAIEIKTESVTSINHKKNSEPANAIFNPYESMLSVNKNLDKAMIADLIKDHSKAKGISPIQGSMPAVPVREYVKSSLQKREEATTIVGNETFIKLNGTCAQSTDLTFIDENLGSVTSYSDCGETDDEKYFREFMKKRMDK